MNPISAAIQSAVLKRVSSARWGVLSVFPAIQAHGFAFGVRAAKYLGVAGFFALQMDGSFKFMALPLHGDHVPVPEADVRRAFVRRHKRPYTSRGHVFTPSLVCPELCADCAEGVLEHDRARVRVAVESALATMDVQVSFKGDTAEIQDVQVRVVEIQKPILNPLPGVEVEGVPETQRAQRLLYRSLTAEEWQLLTRYIGVAVDKEML